MEAEQKTCVILMASYSDWLSVAHIVPELDTILSRRRLKSHVVVVDDSSDDSQGRDILPTLSLQAIETITEVELGSNQGNQRALAIGVAYVARNMTCDYLVVMDADNEDKPEDVPVLLEACDAYSNQKIVFAERAKRSEGVAFTIFYALYKLIFGFLTGRSIAVGNFCVVPGHFVKRLAHIAELWNQFPISIFRSRLPNVKVPTERGVRLYGQGKMNLIQLVIHAFSGFAIQADVIAVRTMLFAFFISFLFFVAGIVLAAVQFSLDLFIPGWTSQMLMQILMFLTLIFCTALIVLTLVLSLRMQPSMIPYHDYMHFVFRIAQLYPLPVKDRLSAGLAQERFLPIGLANRE